MKKIIIALLSIFLLASCGSKEKNPEGELARAGIANMEETSEINIEDIDYKGTFKGTIHGNEITLKLDENTFELFENGKRAHGSWARINDGAVIKLEPKGGTVSVRYYGYSDDDTWVALTDSLAYPEKEEFLKRIPD